MEKDNLIVGRVIEYFNKRKNIVQTGLVLDKVLYKESSENQEVVTGYVVEESETKSVRMVKPNRVTKIKETTLSGVMTSTYIPVVVKDGEGKDVFLGNDVPLVELAWKEGSKQ